MKKLESLALSYKRAQNQVGEGLTNITKQGLLKVFSNYDSQDDGQVPLYIVRKEVTLLDKLSGLPTNIQVQKFKKEKVECIMIDIEKVKDKDSLYHLFEGIRKIAESNLKTTFFLGLVASTDEGLDMYKDIAGIQDVMTYVSIPHTVNLKVS